MRRRRIFQADDRGQFYSDCGQNDYLKQIDGLQRCRRRTDGGEVPSLVCSLANNHHQNYYYFSSLPLSKIPLFIAGTTTLHNKCGIFSITIR